MSRHEKPMQRRLFKTRPFILNKEKRKEIKRKVIEESGLNEELKEKALNNIHKTEKELKQQQRLSISKVKERIKNWFESEQISFIENPLKEISASKLTTYRGCPFAYFLRYELRLEPEKKPYYLMAGQALHHVLAEFNRGNLNTLEELIDGKEIIENGKRKKILGWRAQWYKVANSDSIYFNKEEDKHIIYNNGVKLLKQFYGSEGRKPRQKNYVEYKFTEKINLNGREYPFTGIFDYIDVDTNPPTIIDYKTGAELSEVTKDFCLQFTIYHLAYKRLRELNKIIVPSGDPNIVVYNLPLFSKTPEIKQYQTTRNDVDVEYLIDVIKTVERGIIERNFVPFFGSTKFDHCKKCEWNYGNFCHNLLYSDDKEILGFLEENKKIK